MTEIDKQIRILEQQVAISEFTAGLARGNREGMNIGEVASTYYRRLQYQQAVLRRIEEESKKSL